VQAGTPAAFITDAIKQGLPVETLERLFALYQEAKKDEARRAFYEAMGAFQAEMPPLVKDSAVDFTTSKGRTHYKHASLAAISEAIREPLHRHGLSFRYQIANTETGIAVTCIVAHEAGHTEPTTMGAPADTSGSKNAIQSLGSTVTYMQRYTLVAALGLTTADEDTDGRQDGAGAPRQPEATTRRPAAPVHPWKAGDRPTVHVTSIQAEDKWEDRPQGKKAKWILAVTSDGVEVWSKTESNPASKVKKAQWAVNSMVTLLVDDVDMKDGKLYAKASEVRPVVKAQPGGALLESVLAYKELLLLRDWEAAKAECQCDDPDESTPAALLMKLQGVLERLHQGAESDGEDARAEAEAPDDDPGYTDEYPF